MAIAYVQPALPNAVSATVVESSGRLMLIVCGQRQRPQAYGAGNFSRNIAFLCLSVSHLNDARHMSLTVGIFSE